MLKQIATLLILAIFVIAGINKINGFDGIVKGFRGILPKKLQKLPLFVFQIIIIIVILIEIVCPLLIVYMDNDSNTQLTTNIRNYSLYALIGFTALATILYHNPMDKSQMNNFLKNLAIIGGLILLIE